MTNHYCDLCGVFAGYGIVKMCSSTETTDVKEVCPKCEALLNAHFARLKTAIASEGKRFVRAVRARAAEVAADKFAAQAEYIGDTKPLFDRFRANLGMVSALWKAKPAEVPEAQSSPTDTHSRFRVDIDGVGVVLTVEELREAIGKARAAASGEAIVLLWLQDKAGVVPVRVRSTQDGPVRLSIVKED